jgi:ABC-type uncharacterized transport system involved in gliding motility auxiliary subunit
LNLYTGRGAHSWDLTGERSATLSETTRTVLRHLHRRVQITAFFPRDATGRVEAATLLSRYRTANRKISFRIVDPTLQPGEAQRLGVSEVGSAAVQQLGAHRKTELAQYAIEIDITSAIARLLRNVSGTVCFSSGHGERSPGDDDQPGLSQAVQSLRANGYTVTTADLLANRNVPASCDALVVAAPTSTFDPEATKAIEAYLKASGKVFALADPKSDVDMTPLFGRWGIVFDRGTVVEGDPNAHLPGDYTAPIVRRYAESSPPVRGLGPAFFPGIERVDSRNTRNPGLTSAAVAFTSPVSYLDRRDIGSFDPKVDSRGPISVGATSDYSEVSAAGTKSARILRTRVIAWGDVDFATNAFFGEASNGKLFVQAIDWLTQPEELVTAVPNFPKMRELELTQARSRYILLLTAGVVPGLFVISGAMVWVLRRSR